MDLSTPLTSLIPSVDGSVLSVLAGTQSPLGQSQIHRLAPRGSRRGLALALERLAHHGLVTAEVTNHGSVYRLNREHVLAPAVVAAAGARREFLRRLGDACARLSPEVVHASLFGSTARRDSTTTSDVDLLLVVPDTSDTASPEWVEQVHALSGAALAWSGNRLEIITVTRHHLVGLAAEGEPVVRSWREDAVTLHGVDLGSLLPHDPAGPVRTT